MLNNTKQQLSIKYLETDLSYIEADWTHISDDHDIKVQITGSLNKNITGAAKLATDLSTDISKLLCLHLIKSDLAK